MNPAAGWHGKLPSLGDFATRRLPEDFTATWDAWLAQGLGALQAQAPQEWLGNYLAAPSWRFLLLPGAWPGQTGIWCGVLMPSVDRVGRYFPLSLVKPLHALPASASEFAALLAWLHRLDDLAADALEEDWTPEQLDAELERLGEPRPDANEPGGGTDLRRLLPQEASAAWAREQQGRCLWFNDSQGTILWRSQGLPQAENFARLFRPA